MFQKLLQTRTRRKHLAIRISHTSVTELAEQRQQQDFFFSIAVAAAAAVADANRSHDMLLPPTRQTRHFVALLQTRDLLQASTRITI